MTSVRVAARVLLVFASCVAIAALGAGTDAGAGSGGGGASEGPTSIVQIGDSVAAGEGTLYGYEYDAKTREWNGGNLDATWPGPYPDCHDSPDAYGQLVAKTFDADFTQLACTGATFANGISAPEVLDGTTYSPAQFGNWSSQTDLNERYDAAKPDLVLVTFGADDVKFHDIVTSCVENSFGHFLHLVELACVRGNPGPTIQQSFLDVYSTSLPESYRTLVGWIEQRAEADGEPTPKVVFTSYPDPLPPNGEKCPDTNYLYPQQVRYLSSLVTQMNDQITRTIESIDDPNVVLVDVADAYTPPRSSGGTQDHRWCSRDPWAYGLSIVKVTDPLSLESQAPFHPTPEGQESIADLVEPTVRKLFQD